MKYFRACVGSFLVHDKILDQQLLKHYSICNRNTYIGIYNNHKSINKFPNIIHSQTHMIMKLQY